MPAGRSRGSAVRMRERSFSESSDWRAVNGDPDPLTGMNRAPQRLSEWEREREGERWRKGERETERLA